MLDNVKSDLEKLGNREKAQILSRFFKTGKGEYGEGDIFLGVTVPDQRSVAKKYTGLELKEIQQLLSSKVHEHRLTSLLVLVEKYKKDDNKEEIFNFYLKNAKNVNNWDLVDLTAHNILGDYILEKNKSVLYRLAKSDSLWDRRIAIISTHAFIRKGLFEDTFRISELLLKDKHDLIHKAVGWMLREVGKKDQKAEEQFLKKHYRNMPRTMLRYAVERLSDSKKRFYMGR